MTSLYKRLFGHFHDTNKVAAQEKERVKESRCEQRRRVKEANESLTKATAELENAVIDVNLQRQALDVLAEEITK